MLSFLVTGGAGFIGSNIVERLLQEGHKVRVLDNFSTGRRENLFHLLDKIELIEGDIRDLDACRKAVEGVDFVLHQAALPSVQRSIEDPLTTFQVNALGTLNILIASKERGVKRLVYASSSSVYGDNPELPKREDMQPLPLSPYAVSKLAGENLCRAFYKSYGLSVVSLRYFNVFGPRQDPKSPYSAVIPRFLTALLNGKSPIIYGDGEQTRDFTYVENVVEANILAVFKEGIDGEVFNIACGKGTSVNQLFRLLRELIGANDVEPTYAPPRVGEVRHSTADISKARVKLGYLPMIGIREGLMKTILCFGKEGAKRICEH
ncbi:MAG: SDR family oxidoreductase [bacterium]